MKHNRVSYVRKKFAGGSCICFGLVTVSLLFFAIGMYFGIKNKGYIPLNIAAVCFCSLLLSIAGIVYGLCSFMDKEKNYILSKLGISLGIIITATWIIMILIGVRG